MSKRETHLGAAKKHGRRAVTELRRMTADSALHWVLAHKSRIAQFRRSVKDTRAAKPFDQLLALVRHEASALSRPAPRKPKRKPARTQHRRAARSWIERVTAPPFAVG